MLWDSESHVEFRQGSECVASGEFEAALRRQPRKWCIPIRWRRIEGPWELSGSPGDRRSHEEPEQYDLIEACRIESVGPYPPSPSLGCWAPPFGAGCTREASQRTV